MCEEYIVDMLDPQTLIVKPDFIECVRSQGLEVTGREWGDFVIVSLEDLPPETAEKLIDLARRVYRKLHPPKPKEMFDKRLSNMQARRLCKIVVTLDPKRILEDASRRRGYKQVVSLYLETELVEELDKIAKKHKFNRSELVARIIAAFLEAYKSIK